MSDDEGGGGGGGDDMEDYEFEPINNPTDDMAAGANDTSSAAAAAAATSATTGTRKRKATDDGSGGGSGGGGGSSDDVSFRALLTKWKSKVTKLKGFGSAASAASGGAALPQKKFLRPKYASGSASQYKSNLYRLHLPQLLHVLRQRLLERNYHSAAAVLAVVGRIKLLVEPFFAASVEVLHYLPFDAEEEFDPMTDPMTGNGLGDGLGNANGSGDGEDGDAMGVSGGSSGSGSAAAAAAAGGAGVDGTGGSSEAHLTRLYRKLINLNPKNVEQIVLELSFRFAKRGTCVMPGLTSLVSSSAVGWVWVCGR